jgi:hypothetical protein
MECANEFYETETLLRGVNKNPNFWNNERNRPTSAIFKDSKGISVNRTGENKKYYIKSLELLKSNLNENIRTVVEIEVNYCKELELYLKYLPVENNIYHSEIHKSENQIVLSKSEAKKLSEICKIII